MNITFLSLLGEIWDKIANLMKLTMWSCVKEGHCSMMVSMLTKNQCILVEKHLFPFKSYSFL